MQRCKHDLMSVSDPIIASIRNKSYVKQRKFLTKTLAIAILFRFDWFVLTCLIMWWLHLQMYCKLKLARIQVSSVAVNL